MDILVQTPRPGIRLVALNRPTAMNALSRRLRSELAETFDRLGSDSDVRAVILTGAGDRAFSAGLDLKELAADGFAAPAGEAPPSDPLAALGRLEVPVIAAVNGVAVTGGLELALACDILLASSAARFADTHVRMGVTPGWGLSQRLSRLIGPSRAKEMSLTGDFIDADTALAWGLVNRVLEPDQLLPFAVKLAGSVADADPRMVTRYKRLIDDGFSTTLSEGLRLEQRQARSDNAELTAEALAAKAAATTARGRAAAEGERSR